MSREKRKLIDAQCECKKMFKTWSDKPSELCLKCRKKAINENRKAFNAKYGSTSLHVLDEIVKDYSFSMSDFKALGKKHY